MDPARRLATRDRPSLWRQTGPDDWDVDLHPGQQSAWWSAARIVAVIAGSQGGKTSFGPPWLHREMTICGPGDYLVATSTYDLFKLKLLPELVSVFVHRLGIGKLWAGDNVIEIAEPGKGFWARHSSDPMYQRIIMRSATATGGLESATAKAAWLDEAGQEQFRVGAYDAVVRRLALAQGRMLITTTPYVYGWLKTEIYDRWRDDPKGSGIQVINFPSTMNPAYPVEEDARIKATTANWKYKMFQLGLFERPPGIIYGAFTADHKVTPFALPRHWPIYCGMDFGPVHTVCIWVTHDLEHEVLYVIKEYMAGEKTTKEHGETLAAASVGMRIMGRFGGVPSEEQWRRDIATGGWPVQVVPVLAVESGIDSIIGRLKAKTLMVFDTCRGLIDEFGIYRRKLHKETNEVTGEIYNKNDFHFLDALRAVVPSFGRAQSFGDIGGPAETMANPFDL